MKKFKLFFLGTLILMSGLVSADRVAFVDAGGMTNFSYLDISGCSGFDRTFRKGETVRIEGEFSAPLRIDAMTCHCEMFVAGVGVFVLKEPVNGTLPVDFGYDVTFYIDLEIPSYLPSIQVIFEITIRDGYNNKIASAKLPVSII